LLAEKNPTFVGWDQNEVARERKDCAREGLELLVEFEVLRSASADLVAGLGASDLARGGRHPKVGVLTVGELLAEWVHHDGNHIRQIHVNVQSFVWPHMGNAQKFSRP